MHRNKSQELHSLRPDLRDKLPEFARFRTQKQIKKDSNYYHTQKNDIDWNNKARISEKFYLYYHKLADDAAERLEQDRLDEIQKNKLLEEARIVRLNQMKIETAERTHSRQHERKLLQVKSHQGLSTKDGLPTLQEFSWLNLPSDYTLCHKLVSAKHSIKNDNKWNYLLEADQKYVDHVVVPISVKGEEQIHNYIQKKLQEEKEVRELEKLAYKKKHDEIRERFFWQHERNYEFEKHCKLIPNNTNTVDTVRPPTSTGSTRPQTSGQASRGILKSREKPKTPLNPKERSASLKPAKTEDQNLEGLTQKSLIKIQEGTDLDPIPKHSEPFDPEDKFFSLPQAKREELQSIVGQTSFERSDGFGSKTQNSRHFMFKYGSPSTAVDATLGNTLQRLAEPKSREFEPANQFDRVEYKGLWIKELDPNLPQSANNLTRTLTAKSSIYNRVLDSTRMSKRGASKHDSTLIRPFTSASKQSGGSSIQYSMARPLSPGEVVKPDERLPPSRGDIEQSREFIPELEDAGLVKNEIDRFEEKFCGTRKRVGYPRIALEKAKKLISGQSFKKEMMGV